MSIRLLNSRAFLLLLLCLMALPVMAKDALMAGWTNSGNTWNCSKKVSLSVPSGLAATQADGLLSVEVAGTPFYAGYGMAPDKKSAEKVLKKIRKHLKKLGEVKLGKIARITSNPSLHLVAREGQVIINKVPCYVAMGYFTNKTDYLSFVVFYQASQAAKFKPNMVKMMNSVSFK